MSYSSLNSFLSQLYSFLSSNVWISTNIGDAIYDAPPLAENTPDLYLQIGDGLLREASSNTHQGREWLFDVNIFARRSAFEKQVEAASQIQDLLEGHRLGLAQVGPISFRQARFDRFEQGEIKRISLRFRTRIEI